MARRSMKPQCEAPPLHTCNFLPTRERPPAAFSVRSALPPVSTKVDSSIHRVRPASGFLLVAQSKATRRRGLFYNLDSIPPRRSRLGTNDFARIILDGPAEAGRAGLG